MSVEKRKCRRTDVDVMISLQEINDKFPTGFSSQMVKVNLINISMTGIAFKCKEQLSIHSYYGTMVKLPNGEKFEAAVEVLRKNQGEEPEAVYGCRFIGISKENQFKIDVYQVVTEDAK